MLNCFQTDKYVITSISITAAAAAGSSTNNNCLAAAAAALYLSMANKLSSVMVKSTTSKMCPPPDKSFAKIASEPGIWKLNSDTTEEWKVAQRKRHRNRIEGKFGKGRIKPGGNFMAAEITVPLFVYNVESSTTAADIMEHIREKTTAPVNVEKLDLKRKRSYLAYKVSVPAVNVHQFLSGDFWPEGVGYRRFVEFRHSNA